MNLFAIMIVGDVVLGGIFNYNRFLRDNNMLQEYRNALFEAIEKFGLDPTLFQTEYTTPPLDPDNIYEIKTPIFTIQIGGTSFKFSVRNNTGHDYETFIYKFTYFTHIYMESDWKGSISGIEKLLKEFNQWLVHHASKYIKEQQLPDLWAQMEIGKAFLQNSAITEKSTSEFTEPEKEHLRSSVEEFRQIVTEKYKPDQEQSESINLQLDYLKKAVDRLNHRDWSSVAYKVIYDI